MGDEIKELLLSESAVVSRQVGSRNATPKETTVPHFDRFIRGPIDLDWLCKARRLGTREFFVGMALWYYAGLNRGRLRFKAGIADLTLNCSSVSSVRRGVDRLAEAGLINVERASGSKSVFEILLERKQEYVAFSYTFTDSDWDAPSSK